MIVDIDKKIEKIEKSCIDIAKKELKELEEENNKRVDTEVDARVNEYKDELALRYEEEIKKLNREYNKRAYDQEMEARVKINNFKESLKKDITCKVTDGIWLFVDSEQYEGYLFNAIEKVLQKMSFNVNSSKLYITEKDFGRFSDSIKNKYGMEIEKISNDSIGGCIIIDSKLNISVDNTIRTLIEEKIKDLKL